LHLPGQMPSMRVSSLTELDSKHAEYRQVWRECGLRVIKDGRWAGSGSHTRTPQPFRPDRPGDGCRLELGRAPRCGDEAEGNEAVLAPASFISK
jgi:hypothetical protein